VLLPYLVPELLFILVDLDLGIKEGAQLLIPVRLLVHHLFKSLSAEHGVCSLNDKKLFKLVAGIEVPKGLGGFQNVLVT